MSRLQLLFFAGGFGLVIQSLLPFFHRIDQEHVDWNHEHGVERRAQHTDGVYMVWCGNMIRITYDRSGLI